MEPTKQNSLLSLPGAIIVAAAIVGIAIIWTQKPMAAPATAPAAATNSVPTASAQVAPITASDHILGNPNAPVKLIEYSDPSCPFCQMFNPNMEQVMTSYGAKGQVAWVYRHFPLNKPGPDGNILHPNAGNEAEAMECAAGLGGNTAFWAYEKEWYTVFPQGGASRPLADDNKQLADIAKTVGLDPVSFNECLSGHRYKNKVESDYQSGLVAGVSGTPYTFIVTPSGTNIGRAGSLSYATMKSVIDTLLSAGGTGGAVSQ